MIARQFTQQRFWKIANRILLLLTLAFLLGAGYWNIFRLPRFPFQYHLASGQIWETEANVESDLRSGDRILQVETVPYADFSHRFQPQLLQTAMSTGFLRLTIQRGKHILERTIPLHLPALYHFQWWLQEWGLGFVILLIAWLISAKKSLQNVSSFAVLVYACLCAIIWATGTSSTVWQIPVLSTSYSVAKIALPFAYLWAVLLIPVPIIHGAGWWAYFGGAGVGMFVFYLLGRSLGLSLFSAALYSVFVIFLVSLIKRISTIPKPLNRWRIAFSAGVVCFPLGFVLLIKWLTGAMLQLSAVYFLLLPIFPLIYFILAQQQNNDLRWNLERFGVLILYWAACLLLAGVGLAFFSHFPLTHPFWFLFLVCGIVFQQWSQPRWQTFMEKRLMNLPADPETTLRKFSQTLPLITHWQDLSLFLQETFQSYQIMQGRITFMSEYQTEIRTICDFGEMNSATELFRFELEGFIAKLGARQPNVYPPVLIQQLQTMLAQVYLFAQNRVQTEALQTRFNEQADLQAFERERLGYEMHHSVLNPINLLRQNTPDPQMVSVINGIEQVIRSFIRRSQSPQLQNGLWQALEQLAIEFRIEDFGRSGTPVYLDLPKTMQRYADDVEQILFLLCREACENARRHAQAQAINIDGWLKPGQVELSVSDDGIGFDSHKVEASGRFGLQAQEVFARAIGAQLSYPKSETGGTQMLVRWQEKTSKHWKHPS